MNEALQLSNEEWFGPNESSKLGLLDALFLFFYAFGLLIFGSAGDRYPVVRVVVAGMWASGVVCLLFGFGGVWGIHALPYYATLWALCGMVQSVGWPGNVAIMYNQPPLQLFAALFLGRLTSHKTCHTTTQPSSS